MIRKEALNSIKTIVENENLVKHSEGGFGSLYETKSLIIGRGTTRKNLLKYTPSFAYPKVIFRRVEERRSLYTVCIPLGGSFTASVVWARIFTAGFGGHIDMKSYHEQALSALGKLVTQGGNQISDDDLIMFGKKPDEAEQHSSRLAEITALCFVDSSTVLKKA